jgi:nitrogen fixation/metabolism regulation signal transduction histidine kinase
MVHRKYIKIHGKTYGPYLYHSYRDGDKIKKEYIKISKKERRVKNIEEGNDNLKFFHIIYISIALILIIATFAGFIIPSSVLKEFFLPKLFFTVSCYCLDCSALPWYFPF